jgi:hypothetical protein
MGAPNRNLLTRTLGFQTQTLRAISAPLLDVKHPHRPETIKSFFPLCAASNKKTSPLDGHPNATPRAKPSEYQSFWNLFAFLFALGLTGY